MSNKYEAVEQVVKSRLQVVDNELVLDGQVIGKNTNENMIHQVVEYVAYEASTDVVDDGMSVDESIARLIEIAKQNVSFRAIFGWTEPSERLNILNL